MALFVAILGDRPASGVRGAAPWGMWALHAWSDPAVLATDPEVVSPVTSAVLVLAPRDGAHRAHVAASAIAAVRPELRVRVEALPVSLAVLVRATELAPRSLTSPTAVVASILAAVDRTTWGAWLPSVAKLEAPTPTLGQHVRSWFARGAGFLAVHGSPGWVAKLPLSQLDAARRLPRVASNQPAAYESHMFGDLPEDAIATLFAMGVSTRPVRREPLGDAEARWGTPRAVEFVIVPAGAGQDVRPELHQSTGQCPSCAEPVWGASCLFCRVEPTPTGPYSPSMHGGQG